jgi:hypothetical protein
MIYFSVKIWSTNPKVLILCLIEIDSLGETLETQNDSMCETKNKILKLEEECKNSKEIFSTKLICWKNRALIRIESI